MQEIQKLLEESLRQLPRLALEKRLAEKTIEAGFTIERAVLSRAAEHILSGNRDPFQITSTGDDAVIQITNEDIESAVNNTQRFLDEHLEKFVAKIGDETTTRLLRSLEKNGRRNTWDNKSKFKNLGSVSNIDGARLSISCAHF